MPEIRQERCISCGLCARVCPMGVLTYENGAPVVHPERTCMECWHCAAICPKQAIEQQGTPLYPPAPEGELETLVTMRRSVRHFKQEPPERQVITRALELSAWAPAGKNQRTYGWVVLHGRDKVQQLLDVVLDWAADTDGWRELVKLARGHRDAVTCGASCVLLCHNDPAQTTSPETNCVIAAATAELLLVKQGVGTCWGGYLRRAVDACPPARELLGIPEQRRVYAALLAGIPEREPYCRIPYRPEPPVRWI